MCQCHTVLCVEPCVMKYILTHMNSMVKYEHYTDYTLRYHYLVFNFITCCVAYLCLSISACLSDSAHDSAPFDHDTERHLLQTV